MRKRKFSKLNLLYVFSLVLGITIVVMGFSVTNTAKKELEKQPEIAEKPAVEEEKKETALVSKPAEKIEKPLQPETEVVAEQENVPKENFAPTLEDSVLVKPVDGEIVLAFTGKSFVYSNVYDEWGVHKGVHFSAKAKTPVKAVANGKIKRVYKDSREGLTIEVEHGDFVTVYGNLSDDFKLKAGNEIRAGETVGTVADGKDYLHFEVIYKGENINPEPLFL